MFTKTVTPVYFETRFGIPTFFVYKTLDVVILDSNSRVRYIKAGLRPRRIYFWNPKYFRVLELPAGMVKKKEIQMGKKVRIF